MTEPKKTKEEIQAEMDAAGVEAIKELPTVLKGTSWDVIDWIERWYPKAGYKRLAKALLAAKGAKAETES